ncbi:MAG: hypothetical protein WCK02_09425 [Bacteroidota bacterium]
MVRLFLFYVFMFFYSALFSQENNQNEKDKNYVPPKNTILGSQQSEESDVFDSDINGAIRFDLLNLSRYNLIFNYERKINENFSFTAKIGMPILSDNIQKNTDIALNQVFKDTLEQSIINCRTLSTYSSFKGGYIFGFSIRLYDKKKKQLNSHKFCELAAQTAVRNFKWESNYFLNDYSDTIYISANKDRLITTKIFFKRGYRWNIGKGKYRFSHEFSWGGGINFSRINNYQQNPHLNAQGKSFNILEWDKSRRTDWSVYFSVTYCLGLGWI